MAFLEGNTSPQQLGAVTAASLASAHLPLGAAAVDAHLSPAGAASTAVRQNPQNLCRDASLDHQTPSTSSLDPDHALPQPYPSMHPCVCPIQASGELSVNMRTRTSASAAATRAWAKPPAELTVKHVGFLGSLAHALVHLQKASEGLSLLRAAACIMRSNPPAFHMWFQGSPDPQVLHAHVLMDLVSSSAAMSSCRMLYCGP